MTLEALAEHARDGSAVARSGPTGRDRLKRRGLVLALLLGTWIPMAFFVGAGALGAAPSGLDTTRSLLIFLGLVHVPVSLVLYMDRGFLPLVRANKARYIYIPIALMLGSGVIFTIGGVILQASATLLLLGWQAFHYGRQNIGVYAFASMAQGWRPRPAERRLIELATVCAVFGTFKVLGLETAWAGFHPAFDLLFRGASLAFLGIVLSGVFLYLRNRREFPPRKAVFFFTLLLFFLPLFVAPGVDGAFHSYAVAHGVQYILLMVVLSAGLGAREGSRGVSPVMIGVAAFMVLFGLAGARAAELKAVEWIGSQGVAAGVLDFAAGIGVGVTIAHFVVDAGAWRLSQPSARAYMTSRFGFLLGRAHPADASAARAATGPHSPAAPVLS